MVSPITPIGVNSAAPPKDAGILKKQSSYAKNSHWQVMKNVASRLPLLGYFVSSKAPVTPATLPKTVSFNPTRNTITSFPVDRSGIKYISSTESLEDDKL